MSVTMVVTNNVSPRMRGFLASVMLELAPGVYSAPRVSPAVRERIWEVLSDWYFAENDAWIIMVWQDPKLPGGQSVMTLGTTPVEFVELDGIFLAKKPLKENTGEEQ